RRLARDPRGRVHARDAHEKARRMDAGLGREPDETTGAYVASRDRGDVHRIVGAADEGGEVSVAHVAARPPGSASTSPETVSTMTSASSVSDQSRNAQHSRSAATRWSSSSAASGRNL